MEPSGTQWCERFPTSNSVDDLAEPFCSDVKEFLRALWHAGATTMITATYRPPERCYLMHWAWMIARGDAQGVKTLPADVSPMPGVDIDWMHGGDLAAAEAAAKAMVGTYGLVHLPVLVSRHTQRLAIDMDISWDGVLSIHATNGALCSIGAPRDGTNLQLAAVGKSYGVIKLASDPPHFSSDGH